MAETGISTTGFAEGQREKDVGEKPKQHPSNSRRRTKTGCLTCRRRRVKCDEKRPICGNCINSKRNCEGYNQRVVFKAPTLGPLSSIPSFAGPQPNFVSEWQGPSGPHYQSYSGNSNDGNRTASGVSPPFRGFFPDTSHVESSSTHTPITSAIPTQASTRDTSGFPPNTNLTLSFSSTASTPRLYLGTETEDDDNDPWDVFTDEEDQVTANDFMDQGQSINLTGIPYLTPPTRPKHLPDAAPIHLWSSSLPDFVVEKKVGGEDKKDIGSPTNLKHEREEDPVMESPSKRSKSASPPTEELTGHANIDETLDGIDRGRLLLREHILSSRTSLPHDTRKYKACNTCRSRRVRCDMERPACKKCKDSGRECTGYERVISFIVGTPAEKGRCSTQAPQATIVPDPKDVKQFITREPDHQVPAVPARSFQRGDASCCSDTAIEESCLTCGRQTDGALYCSELCRLAESERAKIVDDNLEPLQHSLDNPPSLRYTPESPGTVYGDVLNSSASGFGALSPRFAAPTPLVIREDNNGVQWIVFEYSRDRAKMEYTIRCDVESVNVDELTPKFKDENTVYPLACKKEYKGELSVYETDCNTIGWCLAELNPCLRGKPDTLQRAVVSWRSSNAEPKYRDRRDKLEMTTKEKSLHKEAGDPLTMRERFSIRKEYFRPGRMARPSFDIRLTILERENVKQIVAEMLKRPVNAPNYAFEVGLAVLNGRGDTIAGLKAVSKDLEAGINKYVADPSMREKTLSALEQAVREHMREKGLVGIALRNPVPRTEQTQSSHEISTVKTTEEEASTVPSKRRPGPRSMFEESSYVTDPYGSLHLLEEQSRQRKDDGQQGVTPTLLQEESDDSSPPPLSNTEDYVNPSYEEPPRRRSEPRTFAIPFSPPAHKAAPATSHVVPEDDESTPLLSHARASSFDNHGELRQRRNFGAPSFISPDDDNEDEGSKTRSEHAFQRHLSADSSTPSATSSTVDWFNESSSRPLVSHDAALLQPLDSPSSNGSNSSQSGAASTNTADTSVSGGSGPGPRKTSGQSQGQAPSISGTSSNTKQTGSSPPPTPPSPSGIAWLIGFFKAPPAIMLFCEITLLISMVFQVAAATVYFLSSPQKNDGTFKDPDFLSLCANFCIQTTGLYVILFGISKLKEPYLGCWIVCVTMLSFACSSIALGVYFVYTTLGDSLMTLAGLLQVWIWKMIIFKTREEDEVSCGSSTSSRGC